MTDEIRDRRVELVEADVRRLLARALPDANLRAELEGLAPQRAFSGLTWLWGPELYRRNRVLFRPFILTNFGTTQFLKQWQWQAVPWKGAATDALERWLAEADRADDVELFRRLFQWKTWDSNWRATNFAGLRQELLRRFEGAASPAARAVVLEKFNLWLELDEPTGLRLYAADPAAAPSYILRHLPARWGWASEKREIWEALLARARARGDDAFAMKLYRRQVPVDRWAKDALALCQSVGDPAELCRTLDDHHPEVWGTELGGPVMKMLEARGRDVIPYALKHLKDVWPRWYGRGNYGKILDLAAANGWWNLWAALLSSSASPDEWNKVVGRLVDDRVLSEAEVLRRLFLLTGVSREWNFRGFSVAQVQQLDDATATKLYERFPALVRGPFKLHLQISPWQSFARVIGLVVAANDEPLVDFLASRVLGRTQFGRSDNKGMADATLLADYFEALRQGDPRTFARRAANVLTQVPAYTLAGYDQVLRDNRLARLLLERSLPGFLDDPEALRDLVEASEIHVQHLSYRVLGLDDDRARAAAADNLDVVIGTLLRPLHRATRLAAFRALVNACTTEPAARRVLARAREALALPDKKYPKEQLIGLIGRLLARWPELQAATEAPVIYRRKEHAV